jgi:hypothetical protein
MDDQEKNKAELFYCPLARDICKEGRAGIDAVRCLLWQGDKCLFLELMEKWCKGVCYDR